MRVILVGMVLSMSAFADDWPRCCDADAFMDYAYKNASSWSDYQPMMVKYTKELIKSSESPFKGFSDSALQALISCIADKTFASLKTQCSSVKEYLSYRGGTSDLYKKDLLLGKLCAIGTSQSLVSGSLHLHSCIESLKFNK